MSDLRYAIRFLWTHKAFTAADGRTALVDRRAGDEETRHYMRVLSEEYVGPVKVIDESARAVSATRESGRRR